MSSSERTDPLGLAGARLLDRYVVEQAIAQGGMAVIYRGRDLRLLRPVCIKVFHRLQRSEASYRTAYEHFVQEAFALSQFLHPNTLRIFDFGYLDGDGRSPGDGGAPFQISELLDQGTLTQRVRREGALSPAQALEILEPLAGALSEAHGRGIVHRDIKPSNILFAQAGARRVVKLCDFGIAKISDDDAPNRAEDTVTSAGRPLRLFSAAWAAPEQLTGGPIGPAADVYALGLVTAFMLLGRPVFSIGRDDDVVVARTASERTIARALAEHDVPPALAEVIRAACRDDLDERFADVEELATGFRAALAPPPRRDAERALPLRAPSPELLLTPRPAIAEGSRPDVAIGTPAAMPALVDPPVLPPEARPTLVVDPDGDPEVVVGGRRLRLVPLGPGEQVDLGGDGPHVRSPARFRLTVTPSIGRTPRLNLRGLNCFVARVGGRHSTAVDVDADVELAMMAADRRALDGVRCTLGRPGGHGWLYDLGAVTVAVPGTAGVVLLDLGPGRELALVHRVTPAPRKGRRG